LQYSPLTIIISLPYYLIAINLFLLFIILTEHTSKDKTALEVLQYKLSNYTKSSLNLF